MATTTTAALGALILALCSGPALAGDHWDGAGPAGRGWRDLRPPCGCRGREEQRAHWGGRRAWREAAPEQAEVSIAPEFFEGGGGVGAQAGAGGYYWVGGFAQSGGFASASAAAFASASARVSIRFHGGIGMRGHMMGRHW
ncbi:MAG TPA: hypothetical protein VMU93_07815 [Caulobacteraceae bacterium]|nr:hypothetical protein [Caulobacteraceae bacterium]